MGDNARQFSSSPTRVNEQTVDICECLNAPFNGLFKTIGRIGMRKIYGGLNDCEDILGPVLSFPSKSGNVLVLLLSLRDVPRDLRCPYNLAFGIFDRRNSQRNGDQAPMLTPPDSLEMVDVFPTLDAS